MEIDRILSCKTGYTPDIWDGSWKITDADLLSKGFWTRRSISGARWLLQGVPSGFASKTQLPVAGSQEPSTFSVGTKQVFKVRHFTLYSRHRSGMPVHTADWQVELWV